MTTTPKPKIPILYYEEPQPGEPANPIPYIEVGKHEQMPTVLFISEYKETGEFDLDTGFGSQPIVDMLIHSFVSLSHLKKTLKPKLFDQVRVALGMKPLKQAQKEGQHLLDKVMNNAEVRRDTLKTSPKDRQERAFTLGEGLRQRSEQFLKDNKDTEEN